MRVKKVDGKNNINKALVISLIVAFVFAIIFCITIIIRNVTLSNNYSTQEKYSKSDIQAYADILKKYSNTEYSDDDYFKIALFKIVYEHETMCDISDESCIKEQADTYKSDVESFLDVYTENSNLIEAAEKILNDEAEREYTISTSDDAINSYYIIKYFNIFIIVFLLSINIIYFIFIKNSKEKSKNITNFIIFSLLIYILDTFLANLNNIFFNHLLKHICKYCSLAIGEDVWIAWRNGEFVKGYLSPLVLLLVILISIIIYILVNLKRKK